MAALDNVWPIAMRIGGVIVMVLMGLLVLAFVAGIVWLWMQKKKYKHYKVLIWKRYKDKDGREIPVFVKWDKGAVTKDRKLKKWVFHLRGWNIDLGEEETKNYDENRELNLPSIPSENGGEVVFIEKLAPRKGAVGTPFLFEGNVKIIVSEADVAEAMRSFDINARSFGTKDNKLLAFTMYIILATLVLVMIIVILNKFEGITTASENLVVASQNFAAASSNAVPSTAPG